MDYLPNEVDNSAQTGYNDNTNDEYEVIRMDEQAPLNNPKCEHKFEVDLTDQIGDAYAHMCVNRNCGIGYFAELTFKK